MGRMQWLVVRSAGVAGAGGMATAGLLFALGGDGAVPAGEPVSVPPTSGVAEVAASPFAATAPTPTNATAPPAVETSSIPSVAVPTFASATPISAAVVPASAPDAPAPATPASVPVSDIPKYTDVAVLALAADAVLPSGKTFRECVELPHEQWPAPVHLYYEGNGRWLVETHVSEVQVVFDEATARFAPRNFAPINAQCR